MPIDRLASIMNRADLCASAAQLLHSTTHVIGIGLTGAPPDTLRTRGWVYFPESNTPFYRVTVFSNYSPANVPNAQNQWSLMAEVSSSVHQPVSESQLIDAVVAGLQQVGFITDMSDVCSQWSYTAQYGYPIPSCGRNRILDFLQQELARLGIFYSRKIWGMEIRSRQYGPLSDAGSRTCQSPGLRCPGSDLLAPACPE